MGKAFIPFLQCSYLNDYCSISHRSTATDEWQQEKNKSGLAQILLSVHNDVILLYKACTQIWLYGRSFLRQWPIPLICDPLVKSNVQAGACLPKPVHFLPLVFFFFFHVGTQLDELVFMYRHSNTADGKWDDSHDTVTFTVHPVLLGLGQEHHRWTYGTE